MSEQQKREAIRQSYERHIRAALNDARWLGYTPQAVSNDIILLSRCK